MTDQINPLGDRPTRSGRVSAEMIEDLAARMNRCAFVIANGWHYFVSRRFIDGIWKAELSRNDRI